MATYYADALARLSAAGIEDAAFELRCLLEDLTGMPHGTLPEMHPLTQQDTAVLDAAIARRVGGYPLQYILGEWDFLSLRLQVGEGVLIPRQDTELLCELAATALMQHPAPRVLDLCAGSGCVGLGVASLVPQATITAVEKSPQAMAYLRRNILRYPQYAVKPVQADMLCDTEAVDGIFDAIVSNPPYITTETLPHLMPEVQKEPVMALDGGADGLLFYRAIAEKWLPKLRKGGFCAVEIGFDQGDAVNRLFVSAGLQNCCVHRDYSGNDRVVMGYL